LKVVIHNLYKVNLMTAVADNLFLHGQNMMILIINFCCIRTFHLSIRASLANIEPLQKLINNTQILPLLKDEMPSNSKI
ncbi:hypothetical protein OFM39_33745, partial [Escherichia coli]|nr:hypothetical protein [Escherichia coli]